MGMIGQVSKYFQRGSKYVIEVFTGYDRKTTPWINPPGEDSPPLNGDQCVLIPVEKTGNFVALGVVDGVNVGSSQRGDKRIFSRDDDRRLIAQIWLKSDGTIVIGNESAQFEIKPDGSAEFAGGTVTINGATIDATGLITSPVDVQAVGVSLVTHPHNYTWTDPAGSGVTTPPVPTP